MKFLTVFMLLVVMVGMSAAYWIDGLYDEEDDRTVSEHKRRDPTRSSDLCIPWRAPCPSDSQLPNRYPFLRCCNGLACRCTLWGNNCKCESRLGR